MHILRIIHISDLRSGESGLRLVMLLCFVFVLLGDRGSYGDAPSDR